ncbi:MAG: hypothetical protein OEY43_10045 [Gammaproteobacteria bacterium]|nr:hypothetical protein [Gammaproteobacteria bacterium]
MKYYLTCIALVLSSQVLASDKAHNGETLHNDKCMNCHDTGVYTRENRRVSSLDALSNQVENCMKGPAKAEWTKAETDSVISYLNQKFYKF